MLQWHEIFLDVILSTSKDFKHFQVIFFLFLSSHRSERVEFAGEARPWDSLESVSICFELSHRLTFVGLFQSEPT